MENDAINRSRNKKPQTTGNGAIAVVSLFCCPLHCHHSVSIHCSSRIWCLFPIENDWLWLEEPTVSHRVQPDTTMQTHANMCNGMPRSLWVLLQCFVCGQDSQLWCILSLSLSLSVFLPLFPTYVYLFCAIYYTNPCCCPRQTVHQAHKTVPYRV